MTFAKPVKQGELENAGRRQALCLTELEALRAQAKLPQPLCHRRREPTENGVNTEEKPS